MRNVGSLYADCRTIFAHAVAKRTDVASIIILIPPLSQALLNAFVWASVTLNFGTDGFGAGWGVDIRFSSLSMPLSN